MLTTAVFELVLISHSRQNIDNCFR